MASAVDKLGYPTAAQLRIWVNAAKKDEKKDCKITPYMVEYTKEDFIKAAVEFCNDEANQISIGAKYHISPNTIKKAVAVSAGDDYTIGLKSDGTVVAASNNNRGKCDRGGAESVSGQADGGSEAA